jgi:hypothetical protein
MSPDVKKLLIGVAVVLGLLGLKVLTRDGRSAGARKAMYARYASLADTSRVKTVVDSRHLSCFDGAFDAGTGRRWSSFDSKRYAQCMDRVVIPALK